MQTSRRATSERFTCAPPSISLLDLDSYELQARQKLVCNRLLACTLACARAREGSLPASSKRLLALPLQAGIAPPSPGASSPVAVRRQARAPQASDSVVAGILVACCCCCRWCCCCKQLATHVGSAPPCAHRARPLIKSGSCYSLKPQAPGGKIPPLRAWICFEKFSPQARRRPAHRAHDRRLR